MKQRKIFYYLSVLLLLTTIGCKDDIVNPESTIEGRINAQKPIEKILVQNYGLVTGDFYFTRNNSDKYHEIQSAYAENGYFIVIAESGEKYNFNLAVVQNVQIGNHRIDLYY